MVVFGGRPDHRGATNVDVFNHLFMGGLFFQVTFKVIEVANHQVNGFNAMVLDGLDMVLQVPTIKKTAVNLGVEGLDPTI